MEDVRAVGSSALTRKSGGGLEGQQPQRERVGTRRHLSSLFFWGWNGKGKETMYRDMPIYGYSYRYILIVRIFLL